MNTEIELLYCCSLGEMEGYIGNRTPSLGLERARGYRVSSGMALRAGGGDSDGSLHSGMIMTKMMMLENDPLTDAWDVRLWYCLAMMADIGMISVRVQHRSNRKTNSSKGNLTKTDKQRYIFPNAVS